MVVEIGDPSRINSQMVGEAVDGIWNVLTAFRMIGDKAAVVRHRKGVTGQCQSNTTLVGMNDRC